MPFLNNPMSPNTSNLLAEGITVHQLRPVSLHLNRWSVKVEALKPLEKRAFKRLVENYLEREFESSEFEWLRAKSDGQNVAYCHFKTFAL